MDINIPQQDWMKAVLFIFVGIILAVMFLGASRSPKASPATGRQSALLGNRSQSLPISSQKVELYPSEKRPY